MAPQVRIAVVEVIGVQDLIYNDWDEDDDGWGSCTYDFSACTGAQAFVLESLQLEPKRLCISRGGVRSREDAAHARRLPPSSL